MFFKKYLQVTIVTTFWYIFSTENWKKEENWEMEVRASLLGNLQSCHWSTSGTEEWKSNSSLLCARFKTLKHFTSDLQEKQGDSVKKRENLNCFLIFSPVLLQPSSMNKISIWVILWKIIYTAVHNSHKSVADCICYQTSQQSHFQRDCRKLLRQREWIF